MYTTDSPYGYWITQDEVYPVVDSCHHYNVAVEILTSLFGVEERRIENSKFDVYRYMFRLGFVRVVNDGDSHSVEYRHDMHLSKMQKEWVKDANYVDKINYRRWTVRSK